MPEICGTVRAYARHIKRGEPTCQACRDVRSAYQRAHSVSAGRAKTRLSREFRDRYREILNEERAAVGLPPVHVAGER